MTRKLTWIEHPRFRGFGCSECGWRFKPTKTPGGKSFEEMMRNFEGIATRSLRRMCAWVTQEKKAPNSDQQITRRPEAIS